jgi:kinesin family protein 18/19
MGCNSILQAFPKGLQSEEQREIIHLLSRVHELQVENMGMQSTCVLRNFEISRRDMTINMFREHKDLCHEIISQQRALIDENHLLTPKPREELLELYDQEYGSLALPDINAHKVCTVCSCPQFSGFRN